LKYITYSIEICINKAKMWPEQKNQPFKGVPPQVWEFQVGGRQVCDKWLKDRRGRQLSYEDLTVYQKMIVALKETIRLMEEVDSAVGEWPLG